MQPPDTISPALNYVREYTALAAAKRDIEAEAPDQAIARAYYAAFHAATAVLHEHDVYARTHRYTTQILQNLY